MAPPPTSLYTLSFLLALLATLSVAASLRLLAILPNARPRSLRLHPRRTSARLVVVLGSGGHTHEMFALLRNLDARKYTHRTYVVSSGDAFSAQRAAAFETALEDKTQTRTEDAAPCVGARHYTIATIPRARRVHQPLYSTPFSALRTLLAALRLLLSDSKPADLIVTNGPATAVILTLAAFVLRFFDVRGAQSRGLCRTVYVESFARVKTLSLSGRLLVRVVDRFLVQWEELAGYGGRAEFVGILV